MPQQNATAVIPLTEDNIKTLKRMQMNHPIPEGATYIAFLEDGDACFLSEETIVSRGQFMMPSFCLLTMYKDIPIEYEEK